MRPGLNQNFFFKSSQNIPVLVQVVIFWGSILLCILEWTTSLDTSSRTLFVCRGPRDRALCPAGFIAHLFAP